MRLERCPSCNSYMSFSMDYDYGNPVIVYICENCRYTTFGEAYITDNKTTITTGSSTIINSTETKYTLRGNYEQSNFSN